VCLKKYKKQPSKLNINLIKNLSKHWNDLLSNTEIINGKSVLTSTGFVDLFIEYSTKEFLIRSFDYKNFKELLEREVYANENVDIALLTFLKWKLPREKILSRDSIILNLNNKEEIIEYGNGYWKIA
jgi:hypothetical protein